MLADATSSARWHARRLFLLFFSFFEEKKKDESCCHVSYPLRRIGSSRIIIIILQDGGKMESCAKISYDNLVVR